MGIQTQAMQKGAMKRNDFMADIKKFTREIVEKQKISKAIV